ncbi:hypothetical protein BC835DRAFT_1502839 [Cytidiella melzeri]|nr:hypothetical protein BC835DRAFT_1502839 [Cytidiella melzeri]
MSRRSKRIKKIHDDSPVVAPSALSETTPEEADSEYEDRSTKPRSKVARNKPSKTTRVGRSGKIRGKLQEMLDMPLDVILDICSHLSPKDLMNLARTSKDLRKFFMSRNTLAFWKAARLNIPGLPPCPADLSEPAYASLMFDARCHHCSSKNCYYVYWRCRIRLCKSCRALQEVSVHQGKYQYVEDLVRPRSVSNVVPSLMATPNSCYDTYYAPQLQKFLTAVSKTPYYNRAAFFCEQEKLVSILKQNVDQMDDFFRNSKESRTSELDNLRKGRREAIFERLKQEGWQLDIDYLTQTYAEYRLFVKLPEVRKAQALTDRIWDNIGGPIIVFMHSVRQNRLSAARRVIIMERLEAMRKLVEEAVSQIQGCTLSSREVAYYIPEISQMLDPDFEDFDAQKLQDIVHASIPKYLEKRAKDAREYLKKLFRNKFDVDASVDPFTLAATAWLNCGNCQHSMLFDQAVQHPCGNHWPEKPETLSLECYNVVEAKLRSQEVWTVNAFRHTFDKMETVIKACGLDVSTATVQELDRPEIRLQCTMHLSCHFVSVSTWRSAICTRNSCCLSPTFSLATEGQVSAAKALEPVAEAIYQASLAQDREFRCTHCTTKQRLTTEALMAHLKDSHAIAEPAEEDWIDEHTTMTAPGPVFLVSDKLRDLNDWTTQQLLDEHITAYFEFE